MRFRSAVDPWFHATLAGTAVLLAFVVLPAAAGGGTPALALVAALAALALGLPLWLLAATDYAVQDGMLRVRSGPFRWAIPLGEIESVRPSRSWLSSPALSLDRLEIRRAHGRPLLVSPRDRADFLAALARAGVAVSAGESGGGSAGT